MTLTDCPHNEISTALDMLRHFRAFLASDCEQMRDPHDLYWDTRLDKHQAQRKLTWLVLVAIERKAGAMIDRHSYEVCRLNHRGRICRNDTGDAWRHLRLLADRINSRIVVRPSELGEWKPYLTARLPNRFERMEGHERPKRHH